MVNYQIIREKTKALMVTHNITAQDLKVSDNGYTVKPRYLEVGGSSLISSSYPNFELSISARIPAHPSKLELGALAGDDLTLLTYKLAFTNNGCVKSPSSSLVAPKY